MQFKESIKAKKEILTYIKDYVCKPIEEAFEHHSTPLQDTP
jgi:hypothetical protein